MAFSATVAGKCEGSQIGCWGRDTGGEGGEVCALTEQLDNSAPSLWVADSVASRSMTSDATYIYNMRSPPRIAETSLEPMVLC